ncbi:hypothetical protein QO179_23685 [Bacillus stercoris]|nr:hypothetical protein [Bacillus stercoris]
MSGNKVKKRVTSKGRKFSVGETVCLSPKSLCHFQAPNLKGVISSVKTGYGMTTYYDVLFENGYSNSYYSIDLILIPERNKDAMNLLSKTKEQFLNEKKRKPSIMNFRSTWERKPTTQIKKSDKIYNRKKNRKDWSNQE